MCPYVHINWLERGSTFGDQCKCVLMSILIGWNGEVLLVINVNVSLCPFNWLERGSTFGDQCKCVLMSILIGWNGEVLLVNNEVCSNTHFTCFKQNNICNFMFLLFFAEYRDKNL